MVRISYSILFFLVFCCSCKGQNASIENSTLTINNKVLEMEIIRYVETVKTPNIKTKYPYITINNLVADTVEYQINYLLSPHFFEYHPVAFFVKIDSLVVPVEIMGMMFNDEFHFKLKKDVIDDFVRLFFPEEYNYFQNNNDYPPPPTSREVVWILTFKKGKFIEKQVIIN